MDEKLKKNGVNDKDGKKREEASRRETPKNRNARPRDETQECVIEGVEFYIRHFKN